ncbi:MAG: hypothetical protein ABI747_02470 [Candidatus Moraniibacteriota bacterium]
MELAKLNFGKEPSLPVTVASRIYWHVIRTEADRRLLARREEMVEYCALRIALELGEPVLGDEARRKFLASVRAVMDNIRRREKRKRAFRQITSDWDIEKPEEPAPPHQYHLNF